MFESNLTFNMNILYFFRIMLFLLYFAPTLFKQVFQVSRFLPGWWKHTCSMPVCCMLCFLIRRGIHMILCSQWWKNVCQEEDSASQPNISWAILSWISRIHSCLSFPMLNAKDAYSTILKLSYLKSTNMDLNKTSVM